jgi:hypothetical protein
MKHAVRWLNARAVEAWLFFHYDIGDLAERLGRSLRRR